MVQIAVCTIAEDFKTTNFKGQTQEFVGKWLERNNLSK